MSGATMNTAFANPFDLTGKVAMVTGSRTGLGQAVAIALSQAGASIVGVDRGPAEETRAAIEAQGGAFLAVTADLSTTAPLPEVVQSALDRFGALDILVNNAGIIRRADALDFTEEDWDAVIDVNLKSAFFLAQAAARAMLASRADGRPAGGKIINIASMLSFQGGIRVASYTSAKSGLMGLTKLLACEWAAKGINVNAIAPGYMATNNTAPLRADAERNGQILARIPAGRWGAPADLGGAAVFLASQASAYVHGITIPVDGGWLAR
ncbi:2-dehydro-3-deoxy-D-gluconate 5-dehydrogenase KduD [Labrys sp. LIt4]|uniref:2-dehydro-3-deoxy-D-gluconate 5-dehydrogenase KduD n=1 Tax=Labrys sp. LIt4 TaxID=2821355 RepID=UPI001FD72561|nr:2-dehydro-3-deoxy-D-gluconate 5-dehydrogenase KduD [Labrys sp. LIt4]